MAGPVCFRVAIIFFAYIGFDAVTTAAEEVKNPSRTFPIAIMVISIILYISVTLILNGMVPYYLSMKRQSQWHLHSKGWG